MQGETEGKKKKRRKKKSKFWYYVYAVTILLLTITNITLATLLMTHVQSVQVTGNVNSKKNEILAWIGEDTMTNNSLYMLWKFKSGSYKLPVYLEDASVSLKAPWKVRVKVAEKRIIGCVFIENEYVYFDEEGLVLKKTSEYEKGVPLIEGIQVEDADRFAYLTVDDEKVFSYIVNLTEEVEKSKLSPDRIVWEDEGLNLYFEQICVRLGKSNFNEKVLHLPPILEKLEGQSGVLQMEHYTSDSKNISFQKQEETGGNTDDEKSMTDS